MRSSKRKMRSYNMPSPRPKLLVFSKLFWPEGSGAELATYLTVRNILSKYFDITIVSGTRRPYADTLKYTKYVYWNVLETTFKPVEWIKIFANTRHVEKLLRNADIMYIPSHTLIPMAIIAKSIKPDIKVVLHLHNYQLLTYTSVVLAERKHSISTDIIVERGEHNNMLRTFLAGLGHYLNYLNIHSLHYVDNVICVSRRQCEIILRHLPELSSKAVVVYNPPPPLPYIEKKPSSEPILLYVGGESYIKGFHTFVKSIPKILRKFNCKIYVTYTRNIPSKQRSLLKELSLKLDHRVVALGRLSHEKYLKMHEAAWGLLFPSIYEEPLPYTVVEACLTGTIPVASNVGGIPEILNGTPTEKYMFRAGDTEEFSRKIEMLVSENPDTILDIGEETRKFVLKRLETSSSRLAKVFTNIL
jgi:glycosyltransferase involved in cell wall biosynthesis